MKGFGEQFHQNPERGMPAPEATDIEFAYFFVQRLEEALGSGNEADVKFYADEAHALLGKLKDPAAKMVLADRLLELGGEERLAA
jgi:hypothetical protein